MLCAFLIQTVIVRKNNQGVCSPMVTHRIGHCIKFWCSESCCVGSNEDDMVSVSCRISGKAHKRFSSIHWKCDIASDSGDSCILVLYSGRCKHNMIIIFVVLTFVITMVFELQLTMCGF